MWVLIESLKHKTWWPTIIATIASCLSMKGRRMGALFRDRMAVKVSWAAITFFVKGWFKRIRGGWGER